MHIESKNMFLMNQKSRYLKILGNLNILNKKMKTVDQTHGRHWMWFLEVLPSIILLEKKKGWKLMS